MGNVGLFALLILSIAVILLLVMKFKINAAISLLVACIIMGIGSGMELMELVDAINVGFAGFMESTGLSIGLGIIMGQLLYDYGGANSIARSVLRSFPKKKGLLCIGDRCVYRFYSSLLRCDVHPSGTSGYRYRQRDEKANFPGGGRTDCWRRYHTFLQFLPPPALWLQPES